MLHARVLGNVLVVFTTLRLCAKRTVISDFQWGFSHRFQCRGNSLPHGTSKSARSIWIRSSSRAFWASPIADAIRVRGWVSNHVSRRPRATSSADQAASIARRVSGVGVVRYRARQVHASCSACCQIFSQSRKSGGSSSCVWLIGRFPSHHSCPISHALLARTVPGQFEVAFSR